VSAFVLTLRASPPQRVDLSPLTPDRLRGLNAGVERIALVSGNQRIPVGELFDVVAGDPGEIIIRGSCARFDFIGEGMNEGAITVEGDAGAYLAQGMRGGRLHVTGSAGPFAAAELRGGMVAIDGNAGDFLGSARPGERRGMSGGLVSVGGYAGERAGDRMRRGIIAVSGNVGAYAGSRMIAGTLLVFGDDVGPYPGFGMKRGTLVVRHLPQQFLPTFADCGAHELGFLKLLRHALSSCAKSLDARGARVRRFVGDAAIGGKGEILVWRN
jgi:formylmethanofuran dehydrogenase subunit C